MGVRLRDDVVGSLRLAGGGEWWVPVELLGAIAGFVVWVAGSAALGSQVASLADYALLPGGTPTMPVLGVAALLWLVLPAAVATVRVRSRLVNIRGNVEQDYRFDRPAALLVPPALLLAVLAVVVVAMGGIEPLLAVVLAPVALYFLFRTIAYSYRVYAFSHPMLLYVALFVTLALQAGVLLAYLGLATENGAAVRASIAALGLPIDPLSSVEVASLVAPVAPLVAVAVPVGAAVVYLLVQSLLALSLRVRDPTIDPTRVRTGQRYPPWLDVGTRADRTAGSGSDGGGSSANAAANGGTDTESTESDTPATTADTATNQAPEANDEPEETDEPADSVSHTRVFTPPGGGDDDPLAATTDEGSECPDCGATVPAAEDTCPACGADV